MIQLIHQKLGPIGNLISFSKSTYRKLYPNNVIVFNSNLIIDGEKIWYGDIDVTKSKNELIELSKELNKTIYILYEMDGRFSNEESPLINNYVVKIDPNENINLHKRLVDFYKL